VSEPAGAVRPLVETEELARRVGELGTELTAVYRGAPDPPVAVGILKGSSLFLADLLRAMPLDVAVDFMSISSYPQGGHTGVVRILKDLEQDVGGRDVLIVEDIVDTGLTLNYLRAALLERRPRSLRTVALLNKRVRRIATVPVEHTGFEIPDVFVIGYGLDFEGLYRNLDLLLAVDDVAQLTENPRLLVDPETQTIAGGSVSFGP
jgi:hypoxanthine phosphoribosyltransferase